MDPFGGSKGENKIRAGRNTLSVNTNSNDCNLYKEKGNK